MKPSSPARFILLSPYYPPEVSAVAVRLRAFVRFLAEAGHPVRVLTGMPNHPTGIIFPPYRRRIVMKEQIDGIAVSRVWLYASAGAGIRRLLNYLSFTVTCFLPLLFSRRADYLLVESPPPFIMLPAVLVARLKRMPVLLIVADMWPDTIVALGLMKPGRALRLAQRLERWSYRSAARITSLTTGISERLVAEKGVPAGKVLFLPNGVDLDLYAPAPPDEEVRREYDLPQGPILLYTGTHGFAHGLGVALDAAAMLADTPIQFVFFGSGSEKETLVARARDMQLTNVHFRAPVVQEVIPRLYSLAFAGLSTVADIAMAEEIRPAKTFPIMACGKPVVYSGRGEGARLIADSRAGLVAGVADPRELATAIKRLFEDPELAVEMGSRGREYIREHLAWDHLVAAWLEQLEQAELASRRAS
ncbi:MAG: glycosyltransferase family 4 protein [Armatimonadetes bacterium]|nr:glycosyltransferase family 4 protein [Armatimonadota bacterium]MDE2207788.1 glycosyltransferase family 4 protein [Armatimonadota bacterium]